MRRFLIYWTLTFLLFLPSWGLTALRGMASPVDLLWTAALAGTLAGLAAFGTSSHATRSMSSDAGSIG
jgi:steroid 5-alpha reductase family enzyme